MADPNHLELILTADDDDAYTPGRVVTLTYPNYANLPTSGSLTITLTVNDDEAPPAPPANADGSFTVPAGWALIPSGVEPGDRFRLLFKTSMSRDASSADIADYNTFVQQAAAGGHGEIQKYAALFRAVGCTSAVDARVNTDSESTDDDAKIFWLNGGRLADDYADFYDGTWDTRSIGNERDESGAAQSDNAFRTWTGCQNDGTAQGFGSLRIGQLGNTTSIWYGSSRGDGHSPLSVNAGTGSTDYPFYAMSPVFVAQRASGVNDPFDLSSLDASSPAGFVFRVCGSDGGGTNCDLNAGDGDTSWVPTLNPVVRLVEGGGAGGDGRVSYQYKFHWPGGPPAAGARQTCVNGACRTVPDHISVVFDNDAFFDIRNAYRHDRDRLNCFDPPAGSPGHDAGTWGAYVKHQANRDKIADAQRRADNGEDVNIPILPTNELWLHARADGSNVGNYPGRTDGAKVVYDMWGGCRSARNHYVIEDYDQWQTVTLGAGHDADAFSHDVTLTHKVHGWGHLGRMAGVTAHRAPQVRVHIVDDDEWDQNIEAASYDGTTTGMWHLLERQGLQKALPDEMDVGVTYRFKVRLKNQSPSEASYSYPYSLHPQSGGVTISTDKQYTDDPPYGVAWSWSSNGSINADDEVVVSVRKDSAGPLVIRQRAPGLRQRTDTQLPRNLGADINDPVTALATDATYTTKGYGFEEYSTVGCVGCPATNDDDGDGGDGLTPDPNDGDGDGDGGDGLTPPVTDTDDGDAVVDPLVKYAALVKSFYDRISDRHQHGDSASGGWNKRFLKAMGHPEYVNYPQPAVTAARATELYNHGGPGANTAWEGTAEAIQYRLDYDASTLTPVIPPPPDPDPVITISAGSAITEGGTATFTVTATPPPASPITVNIGVSQSGSFGAAGAVTLTVSGATTTYTVTTADDDADEPDGSVTATIQTGTGYTVGTASTATVNVADDDNPPPPDPDPVITISGGAAVTEGGTATFTISASPAPATPITVNIGVAESGSFGAAGAATLAVSGAATTYTVTTADDDTDEADGSVTATVQTGTGYTVGTASAATVAVTDDDDPPIVVDPTAGFVSDLEQLRGDYSAYADWATGTFHQYMVHYSAGEILALLNSDSPVTNSISNQALFFRAIRAAKGTRDTGAAALFAEIRDNYNIKKIG